MEMNYDRKKHQELWGGDTKAWEEKIIKRQQETFGGDGCVHILIVVIASWIYTYVKL